MKGTIDVREAPPRRPTGRREVQGRTAPSGPSPIASAALLAGIAAILAAVPWPLGSNRAWAAALLFLTSASLLAATGLGLALGRLRLVRSPVAAVGALLLVAGVIGWILVQAGPAPWPELAHPVWALLPEELAATPAIALDPPAAREALLRLLAPVSLLLAAFVLAADREHAERLLRIVLLVVCAQAAFALARVVLGWDLLLGVSLPLQRISGSFVNPNHFAAYVNMGAVIALVLLLERARGEADSPRLGPALARLLATALQTRPLLVAALFLCLLAAAASASRGGALALLPTLLVLFAVGLRGARRPLLLVGLALLAALLGWAVSSGGELLWERLVRLDPSSEFSPGLQGRVLAFGFALEQIAARPWLGHGYGGFPSLFNHARDERFGPGLLWDYVHNSYLELAVELGLVAAGALALAVLLLLLPCLRAIRRGTSSPLPLVAIGVTLVQALHALVDFAWQIPAVTATWAVLAGLGLGRAALTLERRDPSRNARG